MNCESPRSPPVEDDLLHLNRLSLDDDLFDIDVTELGFDARAAGDEEWLREPMSPDLGLVSSSSTAACVASNAAARVVKAAPFVTKLYDIVGTYPDVCDFGPEGHSLIVLDQKVIISFTVGATFFSQILGPSTP